MFVKVENSLRLASILIDIPDDKHKIQKHCDYALFDSKCKNTNNLLKITYQLQMKY